MGGDNNRAGLDEAGTELPSISPPAGTMGDTVSRKTGAREGDGSGKDPDEAEDEDEDEDDDASDYSSVSVDELPSIHVWGRTYHGSGLMLHPNDDIERARLEVQHRLFKLCLDGGLTAAKLPTDRPLTILDIGCGTGRWAIEMGEAYPEAHIMGIDLSAAWLPTQVPPNVSFEIEDASKPWARLKDSLDFAHCRNLVGGGIRDWRALIAEAYHHLKPGGQIEFAEIRPRWWDFEDGVDGEEMDRPLSAEKGPAYHQVLTVYAEMEKDLGVDFDPIPRLPGLLTDVGFEKVVEMSDLVPIGAWGNDQKMVQKGTCFSQIITAENFEGYSMMLFKMNGWSESDARALMATVTAEARDPSLRIYGKVGFVTGRKPLKS